MTSLYTALSGLQAHQGAIDVVGHNLANSNTPGYKSSRAVFASHFSQTLSFGSGPGGNLGGTNPIQIGNGVSLGDIGRTFSQGALTQTGRTFDLALEGRGFFALSNGSQSFYSRVGTFGLDALHNLVDQSTGMRVLNPANQPVSVDVDSLFPPQVTSEMEFTGNLPANVTGPLQEVLTAASSFSEGTAAQVLGTGTGPFAIPAGSTYTMEIVVNGEPPQTVSVPGAAGGVTAQAVVDQINLSVPGVTASVVGGAVQIETERKGEDFSIKINPGTPGADLASTVGIATSLVTGSEVPVSSSTGLNFLPGNVTEYAAGDQIDITGLDTDGSPIAATFVYGTDGTTVGELVSFLDSLYTDASVTLDSEGRIQVEAQTAGEANLMLSILDGVSPGQVGQSDWSTYALSTSTQGTGPDIVNTSMEVYDPSGTPHTMGFEFERQQDGTWTATPSLLDDDGTILSTPITGITFADDGTPTGLAGINTDVVVQFTGQSSPQTVSLDFGEDGDFSGLTQYGSDANVWVSNQDGYGVGELSSLSVDHEGTISGFYTNGQSMDLGAIAVVTFANPEGLSAQGDNLFIETPNSGARVMSTGAVGAAGKVVGGSLENSNVDTAAELVHLIEAQRGYQANARVISTQDEVLAELVNIV